MLFLSTKLYNIPLFSIRSGGRIGTVIEPIINPHNLHIDGFYCEAINNQNVQILLDMNVRELSTRGLIIDDHTDLSTPEELVRMQAVLDINFNLIGKLAVVSKKKVGKINQFAIDTEGLFVQKMYVQPRGWQSFKTDSLTFDRSAVIEVTDTSVVFSGPEVKASTSLQTGQKLGVNYSANASTISE